MKNKELSSVLNELQTKPISSSSVTTKETRQTSTNATVISIIVTPNTTETRTTTEATSTITTTTSTSTTKTTTKTTASNTLPIESSKPTSSKVNKLSKSTKSNSYVTEIGAIESSKVSTNITNSTPSPSSKNFTSNQLSIITLSALLGCIYGVAFIIASTWVGFLWLKRRRKSSEFKSSRIDTDFNTIDSSNCIHRA